VSNAFDDPDGSFLVLANDEGQCSLWPVFADVPSGWRVVRAAGDRAGAIAFVTSWDALPGSRVG
jgi:uncharacterized protein YbdZ (MbtH family)